MTGSAEPSVPRGDHGPATASHAVLTTSQQPRQRPFGTRLAAGYHRLVDGQIIDAENEPQAYELARRANTLKAEAALLSRT